MSIATLVEDSRLGSPWVGGQYVPLEFFPKGRRWGSLPQLRLGVVDVHIIANPDELWGLSQNRRTGKLSHLLICMSKWGELRWPQPGLPLGSCLGWADQPGQKANIKADGALLTIKMDFLPERRTCGDPQGRDPRTRCQEPKFTVSPTCSYSFKSHYYLVILFRLCWTNIDDLPLKVFWQILYHIKIWGLQLISKFS